MIQKRLHRILQKRCGDDDATKIEIPPLSMYERMMADDIVDPDDIECSFQDVGGLDDTKREIYELAVVPLLQPELFTGKLVQPCKGILLYGKPGTGKTMLAKALAKESQSIFLPLQLSKILNKYWGESNKLIAATFSLAHKLQPAIIFIDELDTFLRNTSEQTAYMDSIKAEFLTLWDGIGTVGNSQVMVLGATNKPQNIDSAILRRMPRTFEVPLPNVDGRLSILQLLTKDENVEPDTNLPKIANWTVGYSGSDLKELCKAAAMVGVRERTSEFARRRVMGETVSESDQSLLKHKLQALRPINENDFIIALGKVKRSGEVAHQYGEERRREEEKQTLADGSGNANASLRQLLTLLRTLSSLSIVDKIDDINNDDDDELPEIR